MFRIPRSNVVSLVRYYCAYCTVHAYYTTCAVSGTLYFRRCLRSPLELEARQITFSGHSWSKETLAQILDTEPSPPPLHLLEPPEPLVTPAFRQPAGIPGSRCAACFQVVIGLSAFPSSVTANQLPNHPNFVPTLDFWGPHVVCLEVSVHTHFPSRFPSFQSFCLSRRLSFERWMRRSACLDHTLPPSDAFRQPLPPPPSRAVLSFLGSGDPAL